MRVFFSFSSLAALLALAAPSALTQTNAATWRYDNSRTGQNTLETQLTPANVTVSKFGKLSSYILDGYVYAQPLYIAALGIGGAKHNVVFVATEHDSVYALDADTNHLLWQASLLDTAHGASAGATTVPSADVGTSDIVPEIGITGTPVIDPATNTLYVVAKSKENGQYLQRLHALDITTGNERSSSPVAINASVPGTGDGSSGAQVAFLPKLGLERVGLLFLNGHVYFAMASHGDNGPYHGWIFAYDAQTLQQTGVYNTSPNGSENGVWESGAGLAADLVNPYGRLFFANGNGTFDAKLPYTNNMSFGDGVVRLDLSNGGTQVSDAWVPYNYSTLNASDVDQGSGGTLLLPDQAGTHPHELIQGGKNGVLEVLDRDNLGGFNAQSNNVVQELPNQGGVYSTPAYWNGNIYLWAKNDVLKQFTLSGGRLSTSPVKSAQQSSGFPGASPVVSSNGTANGIVWALKTDGYPQGNPSVLYAFDASDVSKLLYSSAQNSARDSAAPAVKFTVPMVMNGKVYVGAQKELDVYGELASTPQVAPAPVFNPAGGGYASAQTVTLSDSISGATVYYTTDGSTPTTSSKQYSGPIPISTTSTVQAFALAPGYTPSSVAQSTYTIENVPTINFPLGFASVAGLQLNGSTIHSDDSRLQITSGGQFQAGSAFWATPVSIAKFTTDFAFQLSGTADGITFTIQNSSPTALGSAGGGLGYGSDTLKGPLGIGRSIALKFDIYNNAGEGVDSTGVFLNGASPTIPATDLTGSGVKLGSGDVIQVHEDYDGQTLKITIKDTVTGGFMSGSLQGSIPQVLGSTTGYIGFTGGTGGLTASQKILRWTFTSNQ